MNIHLGEQLTRLLIDRYLPDVCRRPAANDLSRNKRFVYITWLRLRAAGEFGENCRMKCEMSACGSATKSDLERPLSLARSSRLAPVDDVERWHSHVDLTEAPLVKDGVTQYEGNTLLLSNMVLRLREGRRAENPKPARDSMA